MSETKLKPCPCCGGEENIKWTYINWSPALRCCDCGASMIIPMDWRSTKREEEVARRWNTRKPIEEIVERLEDMYQPCYLCREDRCAIDRAIEIVKEVGA